MRPPRETLAWVERTIGPRARVVAARRLTGGLTAEVHRLTVERGGRRTSYVLKRATELAGAVAKEAAILAALEHAELPAPRVIGATTDAMLMTRLPGRVLLMPRDRERWLAEMARMLARIHAVEIDAPAFESWIDPAQLSPPSDATRPALWLEAIALVSGEPPAARACFVHRDYQHFNLLWSRERLTGVVDWIEACHGPPEIDVGHCRLNLTVLFSADVADRFRDRYEAEVGRRVDPWWDVHALLAYGPWWKEFLPLQIDGRAPFDAGGMTQRMEDVLARTLRRS